MTPRGEIVLWFVLLGVLSALSGGRWVAVWEQLGPELQVLSAVILAAGVLLAAAGAVLRRSPSAGRWLGAPAAAVAGAAVLLGTVTGTIPCAGPG